MRGEVRGVHVAQKPEGWSILQPGSVQLFVQLHRIPARSSIRFPSTVILGIGSQATNCAFGKLGTWGQAQKRAGRQWSAQT